MGPESALRRALGFEAVICSRAMRDLFQLAERIAQTPVSVLIRGETGSGKELLARAIHHLSLRCGKPWVDVNCGALPEHLVESELFGYEKGAFSSADSSKPGMFELAHTGTLFLDEIGEIDPRMQVKLLRVLDGVPYYRLGGTKKVSVEVRVIAATNRPLEEAIASGRFRGDLYHRLAQIEMCVPPLRERKADIVPLAESMLAQHRPHARLTSGAKVLLESYGWPGNIRELRNVVTRAALLSSADIIDAGELRLEVVTRAAEQPAPATSLSLDEMERRAILHALGETQGHQQRAAHLLGISRRTLHRKLKQYGVDDAAVAPAAKAAAV